MPPRDGSPIGFSVLIPAGSSLLGIGASLIIAGKGEAERCFLVGTLGGEGSSLDLLLLKISGSTSRVGAGVGSETDALLRE